MRASDLAKATDALNVRKGEWILSFSTAGKREFLVITNLAGCDAQVRRGPGCSLKTVLREMDDIIRRLESMSVPDPDEMSFEMEEAYNALCLQGEAQLQIARGLMREQQRLISDLQVRIERSTAKELKDQLQLELKRAEAGLACLKKREMKLRR